MRLGMVETFFYGMTVGIPMGVLYHVYGHRIAQDAASSFYASVSSVLQYRFC